MHVVTASMVTDLYRHVHTHIHTHVHTVKLSCACRPREEDIWLLEVRLAINKDHTVACCCTTLEHSANLTNTRTLTERDLKIDNNGPVSDHTHQLSTIYKDSWIPPIANITTVSHSIG